MEKRRGWEGSIKKGGKKDGKVEGSKKEGKQGEK